MDITLVTKVEKVKNDESEKAIEPDVVLLPDEQYVQNGNMNGTYIPVDPFDFGFPDMSFSHTWVTFQ